MKKQKTMSTMGFMISHVSPPALRAANASHSLTANTDNSFADLQAIPGVSLLGQHDGVMDDDLFDLLAEQGAPD